MVWRDRCRDRPRTPTCTGTEGKGNVPPERLRSIVPMFGGATSYVDTLDAILAYVTSREPTTDELVGWHRGTFDRVSSRDSIIQSRASLAHPRRVSGFGVRLADSRQNIGPVGRFCGRRGFCVRGPIPLTKYLSSVGATYYRGVTLRIGGFGQLYDRHADGRHPFGVDTHMWKYIPQW